MSALNVRSVVFYNLYVDGECFPFAPWAGASTGQARRSTCWGEAGQRVRGRAIGWAEANRRGGRGAGIAGSRPRGAGSLEPWAGPHGSPNKHNGQSLAEPRVLAQGDGVMVLLQADRPRAPAPPPTFGYKARGVGCRFTAKAHASCAVQLSGCGVVATTIFGCCARGVPSRTT